MYKWIVGILVAFSLFATAMVVKFGLNPKPLPIIKASNFEEPEKFSRYIYRQLYPKLKLAPAIAFGDDVSNRYTQTMVKSLFLFLSQEMQRPVSIYTDRDFLDYSEAQSSVKFTKVKNKDPIELAKQLTEDGKNGFLVILLFKNADTIHRFKESLVNQLEFALGKEILSFSFYSLDNIKDTDELKTCDHTEDFEVWMTCIKENNARSIVIYKRKVDPTKPVGIMERVSEKDFFIYLKNTQSY